jgi:hypothetical protein
MPASRVAVTAAGAQTIAAPSVRGQTAVLCINRGPNSVYWSDVNTVTSADGIELAVGEGMEWELSRGDARYARCATGETATLHVFTESMG